MDEIEANRKITLGREAGDILNNHIIQDALAAMREEIRYAWEAAADQADREKLWHILYGVRRFENILKYHVDNGKITQKNLEDFLKMKL